MNILDLHTAASAAATFHKLALSHFDRPCPERLAEALEQLRRSLDALDTPKL